MVMFPNKTRNLFPNKTRNLSLLPPWTISAMQGPVLGPAQSIQTGTGTSFCSCPGLSVKEASLPGQLVYPFTGPFCYSFFSLVGALVIESQCPYVKYGS